MGDIEVTLMAKNQFRELTGRLESIEGKLNSLFGQPEAKAAKEVPAPPDDKPKTMTGTDQAPPGDLKTPVDKGSPGAKIDAMKKSLGGSGASKK